MGPLRLMAMTFSQNSPRVVKTLGLYSGTNQAGAIAAKPQEVGKQM
jgi:hypothetical protein